MHLKLATREILNSKKFSFFYILNFTMGLIGLLVLLNIKESLELSLAKKSKEILSADFSVHARRVINDEELKLVEKEFTSKFQKHRKVSLYSMAYNKSKLSRLVHVRAVDNSYPFYGDVTFVNGEKLSQQGRRASFSLWPYEETAKIFSLSIGDKVTLGGKEFTVDNIISDDSSDSSMGFSLAPRVYVNLNDLESTGLISSKSTLFDTRYYKFEDEKIDLSMLKIKLDENIEDNTLRFTDPKTQAQRALRFFSIVNDYLSLVSLVAFFLAVLGVNYLVQNYIEKKKKSVAVLKSIGMQQRGIRKIYLFELVLLSFVSWILSLLFLVIITLLIKNFIELDIQIGFTFKPIWLGLIMSLFGSVLIGYPFLKELDLVSPSLLLKDESKIQRNWKKAAFSYFPLVVFLVCISIFLANSFKLGALFIIFLMLSFLLLKVLAYFILISLRSFKFKSIHLKLFAKSAAKNATQFSSAVTALGLGVLLFNLLPTIESSLSKELTSPEKNRLPSLFFVDISEEELPELQKHLSKKDLKLSNISPMIRAKLVSVNGKKFEKAKYSNTFSTREEERERWARNRGFNLTYPMDIEWRDFELVEGSNFSGPYDNDNFEQPIEVVMEKRFSERIDVTVNDLLEFDIQGVVFPAKIIGIRKVKWTTFRPNFFVSMQPQSMQYAPKSFLGVLDKIEDSQRAEVINSIAINFPNISVVDITRNVNKILNLISYLGFIFKALSFLSIFSGLIIISSLSSYEAYKRKNEINLLKILGLEKFGLIRINMYHYGFVGALAGIVGALISIIISFSLVVIFFDGIWEPSFINIAASIGSVIILTQLISFISISTLFKSTPGELLSSN